MSGPTILGMKALQERWDIGYTALTELVSTGALHPLEGFRTPRFSLSEVEAFENSWQDGDFTPAKYRALSQELRVTRRELEQAREENERLRQALRIVGAHAYASINEGGGINNERVHS